MNRIIKIGIICCTIIFVNVSCNYFNQKEDEIEVPKGITYEQLKEARYKYKIEKAYKDQHLVQSKTNDAIITLFDVIKYHIKDEKGNFGEGINYYIFDIGIDNPSNTTFNAAAFTNSCYLSNEDSTYRYPKQLSALKIYYMQTDSSAMDTSYINRFLNEAMPSRDFIRAKLFAFEVLDEDKHPLFFRYKIGNQDFVYKVRDEQY